MDKENEKMAKPAPGRGDPNRITRDYFESLLVEQRLMGSSQPSTKMELFGETFDTPIMMAALSHLKVKERNNANGMVEMAEGAARVGSVMWAGMGENDEMAAILATGAKSVKIIKPYADDREIYDRIEFCENKGAFAVGMDVDHAYGSDNADDSTILGYPMAHKSMEQMRDYVQSTKLPFIVKGVLSVHDAVRCAQIGCKGIVISHHHGIMRYAIPPLMILPEIKKAVGDSIKIFVDCGFESGYDAFKALALGADAISVGRIISPPLFECGPQGVIDTVTRMNNELKCMMARTCSPDIYHIDPSVIWRKNF